MRLHSATLCLAFALAAGAPLSLAQGTEAIAHLKDVHGNVLVSRESGLGSGGELAPLGPGTRVITTANANVVVSFDNGCQVQMHENQRLEIEKDKPCEALIPQSIMADAAGTGYGPLLFGALIPAFMVGSTAIDQVRINATGTPVSPN
jgi:hypothetical protein